MSIKMMILLYLVISLAGSRLPYFRVYLSHFYNLVSKVITVCLEGGMANKIKLYKDGSGETTCPSSSFFKKNVIAYAANTGTLLAAIGIFYLVDKGRYLEVVYAFIGVLVLALLLWIRNIFGAVWVVSITLLFIVPFYFHYKIAFVHFSIFLASVILTHSFLHAFKVCRQSIGHTNGEKVSLFSRMKFIPGFALGIILLGQSLYGGLLIFKNFLS